MNVRFAIQLFCVFFATSTASAGSWHILGEKDESFLFFSGAILEGESRNLIRAYLSASDVRVVILDSPGGSLGEGIRLAKAIERLSLDTVVLKRTSCESACAIAFMGGVRRVIETGAALGIHAPYRIEDASPHAFLDAEGVVMRDVRNLRFRREVTEFAASKGISKEFVDVMFRHDDPGTTRKIDPHDGLRMGVFTHVMP